jgi:Hypothetical protein (DUF2513)
MKRDMELIRELMLAIESQDGDFNYESVKAIGYCEPQIEYNLDLLIEARLVIGEVHRFQGDPLQGGFSPIFVVARLSWDGHEFLDNARNEFVWKDTMKQVKEKGGGISIALLTQLLISVAKQHFGLG